MSPVLTPRVTDVKAEKLGWTIAFVPRGANVNYAAEVKHNCKSTTITLSTHP